jgi:electron transfer flavoprotein beta subunit
VETDNSLDSLNLAKVLAAVVKREQPELVILGKQAIDNDNNQTGQMLSALLSWPQHTFASKIELNDQKLTVTREIDGGLETLSSSLPAVVTTDLRLNEPRYASLPNIMKAKRKPIDAISLSDLEIEFKPRMEILQYDLPTTRQAGEMLENVEQLMDRLRDKEKIIGEQS